MEGFEIQIFIFPALPITLIIVGASSGDVMSEA
jgi:hypothetical protein